VPNLNLINRAPPGELAHLGIKYASIAQWCEMTGMCRATTYNELARGNLRAVKHGKRTHIDVEHGLAWMANLPPATFRAPKAA